MKKQMKAIDLDARKLGDETPLLWTSLIGRTRERVLAEATAKARREAIDSNKSHHALVLIDDTLCTPT